MVSTRKKNNRTICFVSRAIDGMNFQERERYRDVVRLKFSIKKFLQKINDLSFCMH